jgi:hypothetical protein
LCPQTRTKQSFSPIVGVLVMPQCAAHFV